MDYDYQAEAKAAMRMAAAAISEIERLKLVRIALAWQDLARGHEDKLSSSLQPLLPPTSLRGSPHAEERAEPTGGVDGVSVSRSASPGSFGSIRN